MRRQVQVVQKRRPRRREERVIPLPWRTPTSTRPAKTLGRIDAALAANTRGKS
jgi:hypothetical protein